ncbi:hypothetical protein Tel_09825 [Candidatus Tenderia electrophaga]|jgi:diguanylate cyclase (GGDEF)-like protein|uniref:diguanylate cyclase n=1 Tax=Candidatus Tenderia electrophaga TaxID=1748243 RepID=A0A0S2TE46_9GAMM|nr:hypothetical protein Tel_09825 [Candidatus Tenderia electrophaga]
MLKVFHKRLESVAKPTVLALGFGLVLVLGGVDYISGTELSFAVFYTAPIMLAGWYGGGRVGLTVALVSAAVWVLCDLAEGNQYSHELIPVWNTLARLGFFLIILRLLLTVRKTLEQEQSLADTDALTGLANRRFFVEQVERERLRFERQLEPFTIVYIDLDGFKYVNDHFGHDGGDELLETVADSLQQHVRASDLVARLGGDEFAVLLPLSDKAAAGVVIDKLNRQGLAAMAARGWPVTFSIGAVSFIRPMHSARDMIKAVDDLMYQIKKSGKNNLMHRVWPPAA